MGTVSYNRALDLPVVKISQIHMRIHEYTNLDKMSSMLQELKPLGYS